jgi:hypothetical protein
MSRENLKPGDLVQITFRRRGSEEPFPIGILIDIHHKEYPLRGERELDYIVMSNGVKRTLRRRYLKALE